MLIFLSPNLTIAKRAIHWKNRRGELFGASFFFKWRLGSFRGSCFLTMGLAARSCIMQGRYKYILQLWPRKLWSFLRLASIVRYEMKQETWHLCIVSQFWHQPGLGIDWKVWGLDRGCTWVSRSRGMHEQYFPLGFGHQFVEWSKNWRGKLRGCLGFPDVLLNQKAVGGPFLPDRGLTPFTWHSQHLPPCYGQAPLSPIL